MRLLDRYLLRELLVPFGYCLSGFLIFWISFDLFSQLAGFQQRKLQPLDIAQYYLVKTPELLGVVLPIALLLALLYTLTNHARHHELTAIRAAGVSLWRLSVPYLAMGTTMSLGLFFLNETWMPRSAEAAERILKRHARNQPAAGAARQERQLTFFNERHNRTWVIEVYDLVTHEMVAPLVTWITPDGTRRDIAAERAAYLDGFWVFTNVEVRVYPPGPGGLPSPPMETNLLALPEFTETPESIKSEIKVSKMNSLIDANRTQLSLLEILNYKKLHPGDSGKSALLDTKLHGRLAAPWTCLVVVLIALPFGAVGGRRNVFVGVASSILICFGYFVLQQFGLALGTGGFVPPWLAAWAPNLFFGVGGVALTMRIR